MLFLALKMNPNVCIWNSVELHKVFWNSVNDGNTKGKYPKESDDDTEMEKDKHLARYHRKKNWLTG